MSSLLTRPRCCSPRRATELFDWIRALDEGHPLQSLLDVYSYTAMISLCITEHDVDRALKVGGLGGPGGGRDEAADVDARSTAATLPALLLDLPRR